MLFRTPIRQCAARLPLVTIGAAEIMDIIGTKLVDPKEALSRINMALPDGLRLHSVQEVTLKSPTLQARLRQAEYRVAVETDAPDTELSRHIDNLLAAEKVIQTRRRRQKEEAFDLRPWLHQLQLDSAAGGEARLRMRVTAGQFGNLRPEAVLKALGLDDNWVEIERTRLIFEGEE